MPSVITSFPQFSQLPLELRRQIWEAALEDESVGLCIISNASTTSANRSPPLADVDLHTLMHVCHESRCMAQSHFGYTMRRDLNQTFLGACRGFHAGLDVLYIPTDRYDGFFDWRFLDSWPADRQPHHIALDGHEAQLSRGGVGTQVAALVASGRLPNLSSVSLVFSAEPAPVPVYHPDKNYKLVELDEADMVWCALPGGCKYEDTDPRRIAEWWKDSVMKAAVGLALRPFEVIPRRISVRRYADAGPKGWLSSTLGVTTSRLRQLLI
ncbi:hypothetical protein BKA67DRAFT_227515 [Truncatella angustata]|uniref:2EXR domain-containing protein n=1 Tax=Truncatella angustata TaxID=152316 RepID=A0A9P8UND4_9PEZI|nr:uncharacterized protein BKA67DRAFT_227515 [Truncatella angustata]KAH6655151.1 hypothetical protein BKA67DRAFT_227515 [Truncatella angustata]KAH8200437.1 hypothetical protein TruAng_005400 [Truncatella angustata]